MCKKKYWDFLHIFTKIFIFRKIYSKNKLSVPVLGALRFSGKLACSPNTNIDGLFSYVKNKHFCSFSWRNMHFWERKESPWRSKIGLSTYVQEGQIWVRGGGQPSRPKGFPHAFWVREPDWTGPNGVTSVWFGCSMTCVTEGSKSRF